MRNKILAKRYGEAFVEFAKPRIGIARCVDEMKGLKWILRQNPEFDQFLETPGVPNSDKFRVIDRAFTGAYSDEMIVFLKHLIIKSRINCVMNISDYVRETYAQGDSVKVTLKTTFPLGLELVKKIKEALQVQVGRKVNLYLELAPQLLGGVQMVIGNSIIDGSVRHKLDGLRKQLLKTQVAR